MGWLFFKKPSDTKAYLDNLHNVKNDEVIQRVIDSAIIEFSEYYAATEQVNKITGERRVFASVFMIKFVANATDGMTFGYKNMTEHSGPNQSRCPMKILNLLTPLESKDEYAAAWRERCFAYHAKLAKARSVADGTKIEFATPLRFSDGSEISRFQLYRKGKKTVFRAENGNSYLISNWRTREFQKVI